MSFLFPQKKPKSLSEVVYALNEWVLRISDAAPSPVLPAGADAAGGESDQQRQAVEEVGRLLAQLRKATWGAFSNDSGADAGAEPDQITALAKEVYATGVLVSLIQNLRQLDFDARRDVASFFGYMLQRRPTVDYLLQQNRAVFELLLSLAGDSEIHRTVGYMLRDCAKHLPIVEYVLGLQSFWLLFEYMDDAEFEVATDNFSTFQDFLTLSPELTAALLDRHGAYFTQCMNGLIQSPNYVARRQSLRLLYTFLVLTQRKSMFLRQYTQDVENLKVVMQALRDKSKNIYYEAFQLFKLFVANPNKPPMVRSVLVRNHRKLIDVLSKSYHHADRTTDKKFQDERVYVKDKLAQLARDAEGTPSPAAELAQPPAFPGAPPPIAAEPVLPVAEPAPAFPGAQSPRPTTPPRRTSDDAPQVPPLPPMTPFAASTAGLGDRRPPSPSRAQVPANFLSPRPASPVLSQHHHFPSMPSRDAGA